MVYSILFGLLKKKGHNSHKSEAIEFALSNSKAYIASCLTKKEIVKPSILPSVMLSAAARYTALSLKIPSDTEDSWVHAGNVIKFYPFKSKNILKLCKKY
ncbi:Uncharacterized protein FKW44_007469 [Caligus rogercresseyi]|uniref:Uncharacterized protein n=1 Tax=Caligus rogercresseyi TaxID=217165 RepID=A0A7T8QTM0_CALRO|nr:Uncharacterized protein FKW44_007469 [Caligus rogercresseyi]